MGMSHPHDFENLPFCRAKTVVQCISAGQLNGPTAIGQLLLLKEKVTDKKYSQGNF